MSKLTFWQVFRESLPEAARFYRNALPKCFRGIHVGLEEFETRTEEGRVGAAFLSLFAAPVVRMVKAIRRLWAR